MADIEEVEKETTLLEDIQSAAESLRTPAEEKKPLAEATDELTETADEKAERLRDEAGRFKAADPKAAREKLTLKPAKPLAAASQEAAATVVPATNGLPPEIDKEGKHLERIPPPQSWSGAGKVAWDRLPRPIREQLSQDYAAVDTARGELVPIKEILDVNREFFVNQAGSVPEAFRQMAVFARMSVDNPVQLAEHILRSKGIDPRTAFGGQAQVPAQGQQPDIQVLIAQHVSQALQPFVAQTEQQQTQQLQSTIDQFAADPKHPYFNDVRALMGTLMSAGQAKSMEEAYEMATRANPTIWGALQSVQTEASGNQKQQAVQKAQAAQRTNLKGSPLPNGSSLNGGRANSSVLDDVRAAAAELGT